MSASTLDRQLLYALDPAVFARDALGIQLDPWQAAVVRSQAPQLILNCSRQAGKSLTTAILVLHTAIYKPESLTLMVSPSLRQSSELYRRVRSLASRLDPVPEFSEDQKTMATLANNSRIVSLPASESTVRGYSGVDLLIEDESARVSDALHASVRPMLATSGGRIILLSTPFGQRGHYYEAWEHGGDGWERYRVTAYDAPRISAEFLERERLTVGPWWYAQEYECQFLDAHDQVFATQDVDRAFDPGLEVWDLT